MENQEKQSLKFYCDVCNKEVVGELTAPQVRFSQEDLNKMSKEMGRSHYREIHLIKKELEDIQIN